MHPETVRPFPDEPDGKAEQIRRLFDALAPIYDRGNRLLSLGIDQRWRRRALRTLLPDQPATMLDVACGTGDLALLAAKFFPACRVTGIDPSEAMLAVGRRKIATRNLTDRVTLEIGDALALRYPDHAFDVVTVAFGVRNFADLPRGLAEMCRVLKPGARLVMLELAEPRNRLPRLLCRLHADLAMALFGRLAGHRDAYRYLARSMTEMPQGAACCALLVQAGFETARFVPLTFGICTLYTAQVPHP